MQERSADIQRKQKKKIRKKNEMFMKKEQKEAVSVKRRITESKIKSSKEHTDIFK